MTPLHILLAQAIDMARTLEPGITDRAIADRAGVAPSHLSTALRGRACGQVMLAKVLDSLGCDVVVVKKEKS